MTNPDGKFIKICNLLLNFGLRKRPANCQKVFFDFFFIFVIIFSNKVTKCFLWIWRLGYFTPTPITVLRWNLFSVKKNWHSRKFIPAKSQSQSVPLAATGESLFIPVKSYFWGHSQNIDKIFSKFAWKSSIAKVNTYKIFSRNFITSGCQP